jgi:hypothetical protein
LVSASPTVEILYFDGCPNHQAARELVERIAAEEGIVPALRLVEVPSLDEAEAQRFLGSPSIRVNGHDVEPGADERDTFVLACRLYRTPSGPRGQPADEWVRAALLRP